MPSFDVVSEVDLHEVTNAVDQANRELKTRFDFKGANASFVLTSDEVTMTADVEFQLQQMRDIVQSKLHRRGVDIACLEWQDNEKSGKQVFKKILIKQGLEKELSKKLVKLIKQSKLKVQVAIQGEKVRVTAKKRDDLQRVMALLKGADLTMPLQFNNFRD